MKEQHKDRFRLFLMPSWVLSAFFFLAFLYNMGLIPRNPSSLLELTYLVASFVFFALPFFSRIKLGGLLELERPLAVQSEEPAPTEPPEPEKRPEPRKIWRSGVEFKILNTLWSRQVDKFPKLTRRFTFTLLRASPEFPEFDRATSLLMKEGLIGQSNKEQFFLTWHGLYFCADNWPDFPTDMWFGPTTLDPEKISEVMRRLKVL